jgi:DNA replication ATP-dependent helicase Dna2
VGRGGVGLRASSLSYGHLILLCSCKAVFIDTDALPAPDSRVGDLVQNEVEAELVSQIVGALLKSGINEDQIGVLTLYRQQVKLLGHLLHGEGEENKKGKGVEILTADKSQGRDKDCIIISMVRSNDAGSVSRFFVVLSCPDVGS